MNIYSELKDGSLIDSTGKILIVSVNHMINNILDGKSCFICGAKKGKKEFNDEHVIPDWILRYFKLDKELIILPNRTKYKYSHYKIPCCADCNSNMGKNLEKPIRNILIKGHNDFSAYIKQNGPWLIISWLSLVFFKTHYKDLFLRLSRDRRQKDVRIGEIYNWTEIHHVYCLARSFYSSATFENSAMTSFIVVPVKITEGELSYDYIDLFDCMSILLRFNDFAIIAVLNDGCASSIVMEDTLKKIKAPLSSIQLRELFARVSFTNTLITDRPSYQTIFDPQKGKLKIIGNIPERFDLNDYDDKIYGRLMNYLCKDLIEHYDTKSKQVTIDKIKTGKASFIFDEEGNFRDMS